MRFGETRSSGAMPGRVGERLVGAPGRGREVAVEVDAGGVLARAVQEAVGVDAPGRSPSASRRRDALEQAPREQARCPPPRRAGPPSAGRRAAPSPAGRKTRSATPSRERPYSSHAPAVEDVAGHGPDRIGSEPARAYSPGMRIAALDHLVLTVADLGATVAFYERLGMRAEEFGGGRLALRFGDQKINLHQAGAEFLPHALRPVPGSADLCFLIEGSLDDVALALAEAGVAGRARTGRARGSRRSDGLALRSRSRRQSRRALRPR